MIDVGQTTRINVPTRITGQDSMVVLSSNANRLGWSIQNVGRTAPVYVLLGNGASSSVFHYVLDQGSANNDGLGATINQTSGTIYTGDISVAGTNIAVVVTEN